MNSKNRRIFLYALLSALSVAVWSSCRDPQPVPGGGNNTDTISTDTVTPPPPPPAFKSILSLNERGELNAIPFPCVDWLGGEKAADAFETEHGSVLDTRQTQQGMLVVKYKSNDPDKLNPARAYIIDSKTSQISTGTILIAARLVADGDKLNEIMEILLFDAGYRKAASAQTDDLRAAAETYTNGTYLIAFSKMSEEYWMMAYKPAGDPAQQAGVLQIKDFPLLKKETKMADYTFEEIDAYEKKLGLRELKQKTATSATYTAKDIAGVNLTYVRYDLIPGDESKSGPAVRTSRFSMAMMKQPEVREYFKLNGFEYEKELPGGMVSIYTFVDDERAVRLTIAGGGQDPNVVMSFADAPDLYDKTGGGTEPEFRPLYLPLLDVFGQKISADSPILQREKDRGLGLEPRFRTANTDEGRDYDLIHVDTPLPAAADYSKPRISAYTYETTKEMSDRLSIEKISYLFHPNWETANIDGDAPIIKDFMTENGFAYKGMTPVEDSQNGMTVKANIYSYYNARYEVYFEYVRITEPSFMKMPMGYFTKDPIVR